MLKLVRWNLWGLGFPVLALWLGPARLCDWTEILVAEDRNVFMPGAQPGSASLESVNRCDNCHGGYNPSIEPAPHWRGSMMAHAHALQQLKMAASLAPVAETADTITPHISPTPSGEPVAHIVQSDPYFATLNDWGQAIYDLWLHNDGCPPVLITSLSVGEPCEVPSPPLKLVARGARREIRLSWDPVDEAEGYHLYYDQGGKYSFIVFTTSTDYADGSVTAGQTYCYAVTTLAACKDESLLEPVPTEPGETTCATLDTNTKGGGGGNGKTK